MSFPSERFHFVVEPHDCGVVVHPIGCEVLNETTVPAVRDQLFGLAEELQPSELQLDLKNIRYLTSTALGMLVGLHKKMRARGGRLTLCGVNPVVQEVFEVTHLTRLLDISPSRVATPL